MPVSDDSQSSDYWGWEGQQRGGGEVVPSTVAPQGTQGQARASTAIPATVADDPAMPSPPADIPTPHNANVETNDQETGGQPDMTNADYRGGSPVDSTGALHTDGAGGYIPHQGPVSAAVGAAVKDPSAWDPFKDPKFLTQAAMIMADNNQGPEAYAWLAHVHQAVNENGVQAAQRLLANDPQGAVQAWNRNGKFTDATNAAQHLGPDGKPDGTWDITRTGGAVVNVDPHREIEGLLSPEQWVNNEKGKAQIAMEQQHWGAMQQMWGDKGQGALMLGQARLEAAQNQLAIAQQNNGTKEYVAQVQARVKLYEAQLQDAQKAAGMTVAQAKMQLADDPRTARADVYTKIASQPGADLNQAQDAADRTLLGNYQRVKWMPGPNGQVAAFDRADGRMIKSWPSSAAFTAHMGQTPEQLYDREPNAAPGTAGGATVASPQGTNKDLPPPGYRGKGTGSTPAPTGMPAGNPAPAPAAATGPRLGIKPTAEDQQFAAGREAASAQASSTMQSKFDADSRTMSPRQLHMNYDGYTEMLTPAQQQRLRTAAAA